MNRHKALRPACERFEKNFGDGRQVAIEIPYHMAGLTLQEYREMIGIIREFVEACEASDKYVMRREGQS